jgi:hypothetical protein
MNRLAERSDRALDHGAYNGNRGSPTALEAVLRRPWLVLLPMLLVAGAGVALGILREPDYTAEARLGVGTLSPSGQDAAASTDANEQLAATYSRAVDAPAVVRPVSRATGVPEGLVRARLDASAVPESPLLKVAATAPSESQAVRLARAGDRSLQRYVRSLSGAGAGGEVVLRRFRDAQLAVADAEDALVEAEDAGGSAEREAQADYEAAKLEASALRQAYVEQTQGSGGSAPLRTISPADAAASDRDSKLKLFVAVGALAGLAAGVALATFVATRKARPAW